MVAPPLGFSRFAPKRKGGKQLKIIPIPGVGKGPRWLHLPKPDYMPIYLFQEAGSGWMVLTPTTRHGPFETIEAALTCWSVDARKA